MGCLYLSLFFSTVFYLFLTFLSDRCTAKWRTVDILQVTDITLNGVSVTSDASLFQRGKGIIVDSGTTDTYLPKSVAKGFSKAWQAATGSVSHLNATFETVCLVLCPLRPSAAFVSLGGERRE